MSSYIYVRNIKYHLEKCKVNPPVAEMEEKRKDVQEQLIEASELIEAMRVNAATTAGQNDKETEEVNYKHAWRLNIEKRFTCKIILVMSFKTS